MTVYALHEDPERWPPFAAAFEAEGVPVEQWLLTGDGEQMDAYRRFLAATGTTVAGIESLETVDGRVVTYDVNTTTNHSPDVEAVAPRSGPRAVARHLGRLERGRTSGVRTA